MKPFALVQLLFIVSLMFAPIARAADGDLSQILNRNSTSDQKHYLLAQAAPNGEDDSYDPFADYAEFDEASDEEADINFFKNGRLLTIGFFLGMRGFTENLNNLYSAAPTYGIFLDYFFDLKLALQLSYMTGSYNLAFPRSNGYPALTGQTSISFISIDLKYYLNTQNVTKGLADLNPYIVGGLTQAYRSQSFTGVTISSNDAAAGLEAGLGLEIPIMRRKAFFGLQGMYHYVKFGDSNSYIQLDDGTQTTQKPSGQTYDFLGILGLNF